MFTDYPTNIDSIVPPCKACKQPMRAFSTRIWFGTVGEHLTNRFSTKIFCFNENCVRNGRCKKFLWSYTEYERKIAEDIQKKRDVEKKKKKVLELEKQKKEQEEKLLKIQEKLRSVNDDMPTE